MNMDFNKFLFFLGMLISSLIITWALSTNGLFEDTAIYFEYYNSISNYGLFETIIKTYEDTKKFEPGIFIVFWFINLFYGNEISNFSFIFSVLFILNLIFSIIFFNVIKKSDKINFFYLIIGMVFLSYFIFSKEIYVWRSLFGLTFFIALFFSLDNKIKLLIYSLLAISFHSSYILFILIFILFCIFKFNKKKIILFSIISIFLLITINFFPNIFSFVVVRGNTEIFLSSGGINTINTFISILYASIILFLIKNSIKSYPQFIPIYYFTSYITFISILTINSYQLMSRIFTVASIMIAFLPFLIQSNSKNVFYARILILISVFPTLRIIINMLTGNFGN